MSTKVYKGFRVETTDLRALAALVDAVRPVIKAGAQAVLDLFMERAGGTRAEAYGAWLTARATTVDKGVRHPAVDTQFDLLFIPREGHCLGICYTEHDAWFDAWLALPGVRAWSYWNNTDRDEDVPEAEWEARRASWESVGIPAMDGFTVDVMDPAGPFPRGAR